MASKDKSSSEVLAERLRSVKNIIAVMSGKGGVGKSTVTVNVATGLAARGFKVGVFDADFHGPSVARMLGVKEGLYGESDRLILPSAPLGVKVFGVDLMLPDNTMPVIWRGPMKGNMIRRFLSDADWGSLDYLLIDLPPGTGDEPLSIMQLIPNIKGVILVTHPSQLSEFTVDKAGNMAKILKTPILGVVENMSYFKCPNCGAVFHPFGEGAGEKIAGYLKTRLLGRIPVDLAASKLADEGKPIILGETSPQLKEAYDRIVDELIKILEG